MIAGKPQLAGGAVHAARLDAAQLGLLDLEATGQLRTNHGSHNVIALVEILRAAHNLQRNGIVIRIDVGLAHVDAAQPHMIGIRVRLLGDDLCRDHVVERLTHRIDCLDLGARTDELRRQILRILRQLDHLFQPVI